MLLSPFFKINHIPYWEFAIRPALQFVATWTLHICHTVACSAPSPHSETFELNQVGHGEGGGLKPLPHTPSPTPPAQDPAIKAQENMLLLSGSS